MEIKEVKSSELDLDYKFTHVTFEGFSDKLKANFVKWGLADSFKVSKFRFNIAFTDLSSRKFFDNVLKSDEIRSKFPGLFPKNKAATSFKYNKLKCTKVNMNFFDHLEQKGKFYDHINSLFLEYFPMKSIKILCYFFKLF